MFGSLKADVNARSVSLKIQPIIPTVPMKSYLQSTACTVTEKKELSGHRRKVTDMTKMTKQYLKKREPQSVRKTLWKLDKERQVRERN